MPSPSNGFADFGGASPNENGTYAFDVVANYRCDTGFSLVGNHTRTCTVDGSRTTGAFAGSAPTCESNEYNYGWQKVTFVFSAIACSPLADPINGTVSYSAAADRIGKYVFNVTANHSCDTGFTLVGNNTRTCSGDGTSITGAFDGKTSTCERECR